MVMNELRGAINVQVQMLRNGIFAREVAHVVLLEHCNKGVESLESNRFSCKVSILKPVCTHPHAFNVFETGLQPTGVTMIVTACLMPLELQA